MKRTGIKRGTSRLKRTPLAGGKVNLRRTRLKRVGRRAKREAEALVKFRSGSPLWCANCRADAKIWKMDPHHLVPRSIAAGHPNTHHTGNRAWLCRMCHDDAHAGRLPHLILPRTHLDTLD